MLLVGTPSVFSDSWRYLFFPTSYVKYLLRSFKNPTYANYFNDLKSRSTNEIL